ncbi:hypothetical protein STEG23_026575, partial [Scotinomys teguina]
ESSNVSSSESPLVLPARSGCSFLSSVHIILGASSRCRIVSLLPSTTAKGSTSDLDWDLIRGQGNRSDMQGTEMALLLLKEK